MSSVFIIGSGSIARRHAQNLRHLLPGCEILVHSNSQYAQKFAAEFDGKTVASIEAGLARQPRLCVIASASNDHLAAIFQVVRAGIPFYLEKPVVTTRDDFTDLTEFLAGFPELPPNVVGCNLRFLPSLEKVRQIIENGELGRIARANFQAGQWLPDWRPHQDYRKGYSAHAGQGGGVTMDLVHEIDAANWLVGGFEQVRAICLNTHILEINSNDVSGALLWRDNGPLTFIGLDYISRMPYRDYRIVGENATLVWNLRERHIRMERPKEVVEIVTTADDFDVGATYVTAMSEFVHAIPGGRTRYSLPMAMETTDLLLRIHDQH